MNHTHSTPLPRLTTAALAALALVLALTPAASAQEDPAPDTAVTCDAELLEHDEDGPFYLTGSGDTITCEAVGLDAALEVSWQVELYAMTGDDTDFDADPEDEEPTDVYGETTTPGDDGRLEFGFTLPQDVVIGVFEGVVLQEDEGDETYLEWFAGLVVGDLAQGELTCDPDAARMGEDVSCVVEGLGAEAFDWEAHVLTVDELLELLFSADDEPSPAALGSGTAGDDGTGSFDFSLPSEGPAELYVAVVEQDDYFALYAGEVLPAEVATPTPVDERPEPVQPEPTPDRGADGAVTVPRPTRVETGAGGAAAPYGAAEASDAGGDAPLWAGLAGLGLLAVGALWRRRSAVGW